jgi:hypothetical protein
MDDSGHGAVKGNPSANVARTRSRAAPPLLQHRLNYEGGTLMDLAEGRL